MNGPDCARQQSFLRARITDWSHFAVKTIY
jgi:hypothetical protein